MGADADVSASGIEAGPRRQLNPSPTCCRWTAGSTCPASQSATREGQCTSLHEYLEHKTTTHVFDDVNACLGSDESVWSWKYENTAANVVLSTGSTNVSTVPTPLKVTHAAQCSDFAPTLTLQMDTVMSGSLTVGGVNLLSSVQSILPQRDHMQWKLDNTHGAFGSYDTVWRTTTTGQYERVAWTTNPITYAKFERPSSLFNAHTQICFTTDVSTTTTDDCSALIWIYHGSDDRAESNYRTYCGTSNGWIFHGSEACTGGGWGCSSDAKVSISDGDTGDPFIVTISGGTFSIYFARHGLTLGPLRTCSHPAGNYHLKIFMYPGSGVSMNMPTVKLV